MNNNLSCSIQGKICLNLFCLELRVKCQICKCEHSFTVYYNCVKNIFCFVVHTEDVGDEGEEEKECITYIVSIDIHYGIKSNRYIRSIFSIPCV